MNNFDWCEYKKFAQDLNTSDPSDSASRECMIRNMISRLFYYSYHCLLGYAESSLSFSGRGPGCHGKLANHLRNNRKHEEAQWFVSLRRSREECDYEDHLDSPENQLSHAMAIVEKIRTRYGRYSLKAEV